MPTTPETPEDLKALVAGDLGVEMEKYPLKCATAAYFGARPQPGKPAAVNSGSASLLRLDGQPFALTCSHVLEGYRHRLAQDAATIFQLGDCELDPLAQLKVEDTKLDYALVGLSEEQAAEVVDHDSPFGDSYFASPASWPPNPVVAGDFITFGGFPGELRKAVSFDELSFGSYSSGASRVTTVGEDYLVCQFERDHWVKHGYEPEPSTIRGMSGGPAFAIRKGPETGIITYEFVGHIYEFSESYELLYVRLASVIHV